MGVGEEDGPTRARFRGRGVRARTYAERKFRASRACFVGRMQSKILPRVGTWKLVLASSYRAQCNIDLGGIQDGVGKRHKRFNPTDSYERSRARRPRRMYTE